MQGIVTEKMGDWLVKMTNINYLVVNGTWSTSYDVLWENSRRQSLEQVSNMLWLKSGHENA